MIRMWTVSIVAMLVALCSKAHADTTDVSGTLNTNAWTVAFSPYRVTGNTTVPTGETLTIQPGVEVIFNSGLSLNIVGRLHAVGAPGDTIRFRRATGSAWKGIHLSGTDSSTIAFAKITGASTSTAGSAALSVDGSRVGISDVVIIGNSSSANPGAGGLFLTTSARATVDNSVISGNTQSSQVGGVGLSDAFATFTACQVNDNTGATFGGVYAERSVATFIDCDISDNLMTSATPTRGAGLHIASSTIELYGCTVNRNSGGRGIVTTGNVGRTWFEDGEVNDNAGGIRSSCLFFEVRGSVVDGNTSTEPGGGINAVWGVLYVRNSEVARNSSTGNGGGLYATNGASLYPYDCTITGNTATSGGGAYNHGYMVMYRCVLALNEASQTGGGVFGRGGHYSYVRECTVYGNAAGSSGGGMYMEQSAYGETRNTIVWGNSPNQIADGTGGAGRIHQYCDVQGGWSGPANYTNNISGNPLFVDAASSDFRLTPDSPCLHAGVPSMRDFDKTRRDIGALSYDAGTITAPKFYVNEDAIITVPIVARHDSIYSLDIAILTDSTAFSDTVVTVESHPFIGDVVAVANMHKDTIFVSLSSDTPLALDKEVVAEIGISVTPPELSGSRPFALLPYPHTNLNERVVGLVDGELFLRPSFGDVSADGSVTAFDASWTLEWIVRVRDQIDTLAADVSGNGFITSYDASYMLRRVTNPGLIFPVEEGFLGKPGTFAAREVTWARRSDGWALAISDPTGVVAGDFALDAAGVGDVLGSHGDMLAWNDDGGALRISLARTRDGESELFRLLVADPDVAPPAISHVLVNEGAIQVTTGAIAAPPRFSLEQNAPNPFNPSTTIRFALPEAGAASLSIYDVNGRHVRTLVDGDATAGTHDVVWDGRDGLGREAASGVYLYRLTWRGSESETGAREVSVRRLVLLR